MSMRNMAASLSHHVLSNLNRRPMLTALMVYSVCIGLVAASMAAFAVRRASSGCPILRRSQPYVVQIAEGIGENQHA
jgi:hypothetical protein